MKLLFLALTALVVSAQTLVLDPSGQRLRFLSSWSLDAAPGSAAAIGNHNLYEVQGNTPTFLATDYLITQYFESRDASTTAIVNTATCFRACIVATFNLLLTRPGQAPQRFTNSSFALSRNGAYLYSGAPGAASSEAFLLNLQTNTRSPRQNLESPAHPTQSLADNGDMIVRQSPNANHWRIQADGTRLRLAAADLARSALLTPNAERAFALFPDRVLDITATTPVTLAESPGEPFVGFLTNASGNELLVWTAHSIYTLSNSQLTHRLTHSEGILTVTATEDLRHISFLTSHGRIARVDGEDWFPPLPLSLFQRNQGTVPGSVLRFAASAEDSVTFQCSDLQFPILKREPNLLELQIPWEFSVNGQRESRLITARRPDSPFFLQALFIAYDAVAPYLFNVPDTFNLLAFRNDDWQPVSIHQPAAPGDIIHAYVAGMGLTDVPLRTGQPGPVSPLARPIARLECSLQDTQVEILDLTYAPNNVGVYQLDFRIPPPPSPAARRCSAASPAPPTTPPAPSCPSNNNHAKPLPDRQTCRRPR
jgi:uncharacterized protein (TIGR03437 family)